MEMKRTVKSQTYLHVGMPEAGIHQDFTMPGEVASSQIPWMSSVPIIKKSRLSHSCQSARAPGGKSG